MANRIEPSCKPGRLAGQRWFVSLLLTIASCRAAVFAASPPPSSILEKIRNQPADNRPAHVHAANASHSACLPTKADTDPDVFKRPCFIQSLGQSLQFNGSDGLTSRVTAGAGVLSRDAIGSSVLNHFTSAMESLIAPKYLPTKWEGVDLHGEAALPIKTITESRNGMPQVVRQEPDRDAIVTRLSAGDVVQAAWQSEGVEVLPRMFLSDGDESVIWLRLQLHGDDRLAIRQRPPSFVRSNPKSFGVFFDPTRFHALISSVLLVPFRTPADYVVDGFDTTYEGVRVFHGRIRSTAFAGDDGRRATAKRPDHWWDEMRLFVTDSDPQYFCLEVELRDSEVR